VLGAEVVGSKVRSSSSSSSSSSSIGCWRQHLLTIH
jgi:hypothetical protein